MFVVVEECDLHFADLHWFETRDEVLKFKHEMLLKQELNITLKDAKELIKDFTPVMSKQSGILWNKQEEYKKMSAENYKLNTICEILYDTNIEYWEDRKNSREYSLHSKK